MLLRRKKPIYIGAASLLILILIAGGFWLYQKAKNGDNSANKALTREEIISQIRIPKEASSAAKPTVHTEQGYTITAHQSSNLNNPITFATNDQNSIGITTLDNPKLGTLSQGTKIEEEDKTIYKDAYNGIDLIYTRKDGQLLEEFELQNKVDFDEIVQKIDLSNLIYQKQLDGSIYFYQQSDQCVILGSEATPESNSDSGQARMTNDRCDFAFAIPKPVMYEKLNSQARSYGLHYDLITGTNGKTYLVKVLDQSGKDWLNSASYPVMVDATIVLTLSGFESYPIYQNTWQIRLETVGVGDFEISTVSPTTWNQDLQFESLKCGPNEATYQLTNNQLTSSNFSCNDNLLLTLKTPPHNPPPTTNHKLSFKFGTKSDPTQFTETIIESPGSSDKPIFLSSSLNPNSVKVGDQMTVKSHILDNEGVTEVTADMGGFETITLNRVSGTTNDGHYEGSWIVQGTVFKQYPVTITAKNSQNQTDSKIAFFDPYTCLGGGDHGGSDWNPVTDACASNEIAGTHTGIGTFTVSSGNTVTVEDYDGSSYGSVIISATTVTITGTLSADAKGYRGTIGVTGEGTGGGGGSASGNFNAGGGGHGGLGARGGSSGGAAGTTYGPAGAAGNSGVITLGSAGGGAQSQPGGDGGGAISLTSTGTTTVSGSITTTGGSGQNSANNTRSGGGSGGSVWIICANFAGAGTISAVGGAATGGFGGVGGGGHIYISYSGTKTYSGTPSIAAGTGGSSGATTGTYILYDSTNDDFSIPSDSAGFIYDSDMSDWDFRDMTLTGSANFRGENANLFDISVSRTMTVGSSKTYTFQGSHTTTSNGQGVKISVRNDLTIPSGTTFSANGLGYVGTAGGAGAGPGTGAGPVGTNGNAGGGGYGGGGSSVTSTGGSTYGSLARPLDLGSTGGSAVSVNGGEGGGAIWLEVGGTFTNNGTVSANGATGKTCCSNSRSGGGSGGSILVDTGLLRGSGSFTTTGGAGSGGFSGRGGGGRVSINYRTANQWAGTALTAANVAAAATSGGGTASNGTIYISKINELADMPVAHYQFEEGSGTTANNSGGLVGSFNGALSNFASPATSASGWNLSGKYGKGLQFDGSDDVVTVTNATGIDLNENLSPSFSISAWIYADSDGEGDVGQVFQKGTTTYLRVDSESSGRLDVEGSLDLSTDATLNISSAITTGSWNHIVMTYTDDSDDEISIYINGVLRGSSTNGVGSPTDASNLLIGGTTTANFDGTIDDFKVHNFELTAAQVKNEYNAGIESVGSTSNRSTISSVGAASQAYCVPGDSSTCTAPVGEWKFEEGTGTTTADISGRASTGTLTNGPTWVNGKVGKALSLDGSNDYVDVNITNFTNPSTAISVSAWINISSHKSFNTWINRNGWSVEGTNAWSLYSRSAGTLSFGVAQGTTQYLASTTTMNTGQWYHVTGTYDGSNVKVYLNGVLTETTSAGAITFSSITGLNFGQYVAGADNGYGMIDEVKIYNYARTPAQIAWEYNKGAPVAHWRLNDCTGSSATDASGNSLTGTLTVGGQGTQTSTGTCSAENTAHAWYNGATGKFNGSLNFDGTDDYISVSDNSILEPTNYTLSLWFKPGTQPSTNSQMILLQKGTNDGNGNRDGYTIDYRDTSGTKQLSLNHVDSGNNFIQITANQTLSNGTWYHIVGVYDGSAIKIFLNGREVASSATTTNPDYTGDRQNLKIGMGELFDGTAWRPTSGQIDDVRIYNYALTADLIKLIMNNNAALRY